MNAIKILIAEDDSITQEMMKDIFASPLNELVIAKDGAEAVEKFQEGSFDLIFLDIRMPNKDGFQAVREIRSMEKGRTIPIYALTASTTLDEIDKIKEFGFTAMLAKPISIARIREIVKEVQAKKHD